MTGPRRVIKGVDDLGRLMDQRGTKPLTGDLLRLEQTISGQPPASSGTIISGQSEPVFPEQCVESIAAPGESAGLSGEICLRGQGRADVTQVTGENALAINCPEYTGSDGIKLTGDEFTCDTSVVRTSGNQVIGGSKSFLEFPLTPESEPQTAWQVANKSYVDSSLPEVFWRKSGQTTLHPINEDALELSKAGLSSIINIRKSGDSVARFVVTTDGALSWGDGSGLPDVGLRRTGTNQLELDAGDHLRLPTCADLQQTGPAGVFTPQTGWSRLYAGSLGRLYAITESSKTHDLCAQHKQTIPGVSLAANASGQCSWQSSKHPGSATSAALVSVSQAFSYDFANGGVGTCRGTWTVAADGTSGLVQSQIATGTPFRKYGDGLDRDNNSRAVIKALVRLSDPASLDDLRLFLNDEDGNLASSNVLSQLTSNSWAEVTLDDSGTDTSTWDTALYAGLWARGSSTLTTADTWSIDVKWLSIEQWCG